MTTRDALIEDMPPPSGQVSGARERLAKRSEEELKERHARLKLREDWATRELAEIPAERIDERRKRVAEDESPRPNDRRARTDDAAACLLSYDADARGSAARVPARAEWTAPVASESRRPQAPAAGNYTRYGPTAETAYQPAEYYDDAHAVADELGAQCERYDEYDEDSYQPRGRKLWAAVAILALAVIGTAGAYGYRTMLGGDGQQPTAPPVIASATPSAGEPPAVSALATTDPSNVRPPAAPAGERKKVRTVTIRLEGEPGDTAPLSRSQTALVAPAPRSSEGNYFIQLSAHKTQGDAQASLRAMQAKYTSVLSGQPPIIRRKEQPGKGVYYGAQVGPFASREEATQLCKELKAAGGSCFVQRNDT